MSEAMTAGLPKTTEEAISLSKLRLGGKPAAVTQEATPEAKEQPQDAQAAVEPVAEAKPEGQPTEQPKAGFSWVADPAKRAALEGANLPSDVADWLNEWQAANTRKLQEAAEIRKQADGLRKKAEAWETVEGDPRLRKAIAQAMVAAEAEPEPEKPFDYASATSDEIERHITAKAAKIAESLVNERVIAPKTKAQKVLDAAASAYAEWQQAGLDEAGYRAAWTEAVGALGEAAFMADPDRAPSLAKPYLEKAALKRQLAAIEARTKQAAVSAQRATSPAGTSAVAAQAEPKPVERKPDGSPKTARERTMALLEQRYGWTQRDLETAARSLKG